MSKGKPRVAGLAISLALAAPALAGCGSSGGDTTVVKRPTVPAATADHLAKLSNTVAADLDAGSTCEAAYAADQLQAAIQEANLPASMRSSVDEAAGRLVDQVNCPPPPPTTTEEDKKPKEPKPKPKPERGGDHHDKGHDHPKPPDHAGKLPPGQAKLKGGE